jgi:hypothetical protein
MSLELEGSSASTSKADRGVEHRGMEVNKQENEGRARGGRRSSQCIISTEEAAAAGQHRWDVKLAEYVRGGPALMTFLTMLL